MTLPINPGKVGVGANTIATVAAHGLPAGGPVTGVGRPLLARRLSWRAQALAGSSL